MPCLLHLWAYMPLMAYTVLRYEAMVNGVLFAAGALKFKLAL